LQTPGSAGHGTGLGFVMGDQQGAHAVLGNVPGEFFTQVDTQLGVQR
jgi:hypothetical protein